MPKILHAFLGGHHVGVFEWLAEATGADDPRVGFRYDTDYRGAPLSLSLPLDGTWHEEAPFNWLDNLLPESDEARERLAHVCGVASDTHGLLSALGEDMAGAASLSLDANLPDREPAPLLLASADDIAYRIATLRRDPSAPPAHERPRFSLAGQQAKFSLSKIGVSWFWSTYEYPSTHIFKPASRQHAGADEAEYACLELARELGIESSHSSVAQFRGQRAFCVERWDRLDGVRLLAEDVVQALGMPGYEKYGLPAEEVVPLMRRYGQEWAFVRQLAFNTAVGNSDAHGKNYSLLFAKDQARLAPLYDVLPLSLWPEYDQRVSMHIDGAFHPGQINAHRWASFARTNALDEARLLDDVRHIYRHVAERLPDALAAADLPAVQVDRASAFVREKILPTGLAT